MRTAAGVVKAFNCTFDFLPTSANVVFDSNTGIIEEIRLVESTATIASLFIDDVDDEDVDEDVDEDNLATESVDGIV